MVSSKKRCYRCKSKEHFIKECPYPEIRMCYNCKGIGHITRTCPRPLTEKFKLYLAAHPKPERKVATTAQPDRDAPAPSSLVQPAFPPASFLLKLARILELMMDALVAFARLQEMMNTHFLIQRRRLLEYDEMERAKRRYLLEQIRLYVQAPPEQSSQD